MAQAKKNLKTYSIIVLALGALTLINLLFELFFGELNGELNNATIPDGAPANVAMIARIFILVISLLFLLPQFYIGIKGLKIVKKPDSSRAHIVWGVILTVFTALTWISSFLAFFQGDGDAFGKVAEFFSIAVDVYVLFEYVRYAKAVRDAIE